MKGLEINGIECQKCFDQIYSRAVHDFRSCSCGKVSIDGGFDYTRIIGNEKDYKPVKIRVIATKENLYFDWNTGKNKFGLIKR